MVSRTRGRRAVWNVSLCEQRRTVRGGHCPAGGGAEGLHAGGRLTRITKLMDPALAHGEYIGATLIGAPAAAPLAAALEVTWRRDPSLYYEDGFAELVGRGGMIEVAPIGEVEWVEVDNHDDLRRAREIAARC